MLKEMVIDGIRPPQISSLTQPTVVLANQQQATVKLFIYLFSCYFKIYKNRSFKTFIKILIY